MYIWKERLTPYSIKCYRWHVLLSFLPYFCTGRAEIPSSLAEPQNHAHNLLYFPDLWVLMSSVCKHFRNGYIDMYRRSLTIYSTKMKTLPIHGRYYLLSHFYITGSDHNCSPYFHPAENRTCELKVLLSINNYN